MSLPALFDVLDKENGELPTVDELRAVFTAIGQDLSDAELQGMLSVVRSEQNRPLKDRVLPKDFCHAMAVTSTDESNSPIYRHHSSPKTGDLVCEWPEKDMRGVVDTLDKLFRRAAATWPDKQCVGVRAKNADGSAGAYQWETWAQVDKVVDAFQAGLRGLCGSKAKDLVGVAMKSCREWFVSQRAMERTSVGTVTLYATLGQEAIEYVCELCDLNVIITTPDCIDTYLAVAGCDAACIKTIIVNGTIPEDKLAAAKAANVKLVAWEDVVKYGQEHPLEPVSPTPEDLALICFTSGTTGRPKGVQHSHINLINNTIGSDSVMKFSQEDVHISYLPLAHIFEQFLLIMFVYRGTAMGFYNGSPLTLLDDMQALKPTFFATVPRLMNKIYAKVSTAASQNTGIKKLLGERAVQSKTKGLQKGYIKSLWDYIVFNKVSALLGGRVRQMITGSAPIAPHVLNFYRMFFSADVMEGFGMSEVLVTNCTISTDILNAGTVGGPFPSTEVKLVSVPDMNYLVTDKPIPRGELCFRGPTVFSGYYKNEERTREAFDEEGWFHSGDIAGITEQGLVKILDRKKNIFKLSQGEYVAPEKCENVFSRSPFVAQSFVYGDSLKSCAVAVVVPDFDYMMPLAKAEGMGADAAAVCENSQMVSKVLESIREVGRKSGLNGFELPKAITLITEPFSVENGVLTPTFKMRRVPARTKFMPLVEAMYATLPE